MCNRSLHFQFYVKYILEYFNFISNRSFFKIHVYAKNKIKTLEFYLDIKFNFIFNKLIINYYYYFLNNKHSKELLDSKFKV